MYICIERERDKARLSQKYNLMPNISHKLVMSLKNVKPKNPISHKAHGPRVKEWKPFKYDLPNSCFT